MKLFDSCELSDAWHFGDCPDDVGRHDHVLYMLNFQLDIDTAFYTVDAPKYPLIIDSSTIFLKKSSRCIESVLRHPDVNRPYAKWSGIDVNMDPEMRTPKPFPTWWKEHYKFPSEGQRREFKMSPKQTRRVFQSEHRVCFSDTDEYKHTNYAAYVRFCCDSFSRNVIVGHYGTNFDVYETGLKTLQITYLKECKLGALLTVASWEDRDISKETFYFEMWHGSVLTATASMTFYNLLNTGKDSRL